MMNNDDDLYSGFNQYPVSYAQPYGQHGYDQHDSMYNNYDEDSYATFNQGPAGYNQSNMFRPITSSRRTGQDMNAYYSNWQGGPPPSTQQNFYGGDDLPARPMTSVRAAGYTSQPGGASRGGQRFFDPLHQAKTAGPAPPLQKKSENSPEDMAAEMERKVNALIEESALLNLQKDYPLALEKAKEAGKRERALCRYREQNNLNEQINLDLSYSVAFNLAVQYHANGMYTEALNAYSMIVKNKQFTTAGRLRVNMGNIYFEQKKYPLAIKMYRMALDQIPNTGKEVRFKIMRNIGIAFVRMGQYQEAVQSFESVMEGNPDHQTGFNLLLCYYALGDKDKLKRGFTKLLNVRLTPHDNPDDDPTDSVLESDESILLLDDGLREEMKERKRMAMEYILKAAKLIAPILVEKDWQAGYDYVIEQLKHFELKNPSKEAHLASELEMCKALTFLKHKKYSKAIEALKSFEKKDQQLKAKASTNLSFLYFLEGDYNNAEKYANLSVNTDKYNAKALVNKGNCAFVKGDYQEAKRLYKEAMNLEADCVPAIYNYGMSLKALEEYSDALACFKKIHALVPDSIEVIHQIASIYEKQKNYHNAEEWLNRLITRVPTDPGVLATLGSIYAKDDQDSQAYHYHSESYRYFPVDMGVISWLGAFFVQREEYDKAVTFFERASQIHPNDVKWQLMVASCYRRVKNYPVAKKLYEDIHRKYPDNIECVKYLFNICTNTGMKEEAHEYHKKLKKLEARQEENNVAAQLQQQQQQQPQNQQQLYEEQQQQLRQLQLEQRQYQDNLMATSSTGGVQADMYTSTPPINELKSMNSTSSLTSISAPMKKKKPEPKPQQQQQQEEDEWGDDLGADLLPM